MEGPHGSDIGKSGFLYRESVNKFDELVEALETKNVTVDQLREMV
jgi:hypothetical protein